MEGIPPSEGLTGFEQYGDRVVEGTNCVFSKAKSPVVQAKHYHVMKPYPWQQAVWDACWRPGANVAVATCNESGKSSFTVPILALSFAAAFPSSQVVITSKSEDQIKEQLWPAIRDMSRKFHPNWKITNDKITLPSVNGLEGSTILIRVTKEGERFEGYHERNKTDDKGRNIFCPLLIIVDEGKSVSEEIYEAVVRCDPTVRLYISTTGEDSGSFYDACMNTEGIWTTKWKWQGETIPFVIDWEMCPHLTTGEKKRKREAYLRKFGPDHPFIYSFLKAKFFRSGTMMVFDEVDMQKAVEAMSGTLPQLGGERKAFCDFSGGGDELVFGVRVGNQVHPFVAWHRSGNVAPTVEAAKYIELFKRWQLRPEWIEGDNGGLGAGIISEMIDASWPIKRINPNTPGLQKKDFVDRYAEMHWHLKKMLHEGQLILPRDDILIKQMQQRRYVMRNDDNNRIRIEPKQEAKKRKEGSPDRLDTLVHLCYQMQETKVYSNYEEQLLATGSPKEYFKDVQRVMREGVGNNDRWGWCT